MPGLVTGTSAEYLGARPLRKILCARPVVLVIGPPGVGKTSVACRIAESCGGAPYRYLGAAALEEALERTARRRGAWEDALVEAPALVLDGPRYLSTRTAALWFLRELVESRSLVGRRTILCEVDDDGTAPALQDALAPGLLVTLALRFPGSRSGRRRVARRIADRLEVSPEAIQGTENLDPWRYDQVSDAIRAWRARDP